MRNQNKNQIIVNNHIHTGGCGCNSQKSDSYKESDFTGEVASDVMGYLFISCIVAGILWVVVEILTAIMNAIAAACTALINAFVAALPLIGLATVTGAIIYFLVLRKRTRTERYRAYQEYRSPAQMRARELHAKEVARNQIKTAPTQNRIGAKNEKVYAEYIETGD